MARAAHDRHSLLLLGHCPICTHPVYLAVLTHHPTQCAWVQQTQPAFSAQHPAHVRLHDAPPGQGTLEP